MIFDRNFENKKPYFREKVNKCPNFSEDNNAYILAKAFKYD